MHYRALGRTGLQVSKVGMGCNRLGEPQLPDSYWVDLVRRAVELGVTLFDSSESYGWGRSEEILGLAVAEEKRALIATKVSSVRETDREDWSAQRIVRQAEASLARLHRDCIDIYQLHSPSLEDLKSSDWPEAMAWLKAQGKIRLAGVSIKDASSGQWLIEQGLADVLQVPYNMLEFQVGDAVFPLAESKGVGIMVRMPMAQGVLTGKFTPGSPVGAEHRANLAGKRLPQLIERAEAFKPLAGRLGIPLGQIALRYALHPAAVSAVIPGARSPEQLQENVAASDRAGLSDEVRRQIAAIQAGW